jgi:peptide/nickel transport system permease protein
VLVVATLRTGAAILLAASLSFLGLGVPPQIPEWGTMIKNGMAYLGPAPIIWFSRRASRSWPPCWA